MNKKYFSIAIFIIFSFSGCKSLEKKNPDIYVSVTEINGYNGNSIAKYWKNGAEVLLSDGTNNAIANSIVVDGTDVYVAGYKSNDPNEPGTFALYWKNGKPVLLTSGTGGIITSIFVSNENVLAAGAAAGAKYWKNGSAVELTSNTASLANAIFAVGNDVYVAGYEINANGTYLAKYWKNGLAISLTDGSKNAIAKGIAVSGKDVFIVGEDDGFATLWKNGQSTKLTERKGVAEAIFITADNNQYVVGSELGSNNFYRVAKLWKNGVKIDLTDGTNDANATCLYVSENDVYIGGSEGTNAVYWKNGMLNTLQKGNQFIDAATSIYVK